MAPGLAAYDVVYIALATALYGSSAWAGAWVFGQLARHVAWPFALFPALLAALVALVLQVGALTFCVPRIPPGRYRLMKGKGFWAWMLRSLLRRVLMAPGLKWFLFTSNTLRWLTLKALGAKVPYDVNMSADVDLLDPSLLEVGSGAVLGARTLISGHYVEGGVLILGTVKVGARALLAGEVGVMPGVELGERAVAKARVALGPGAKVGAGASLGAETGLDVGASVGANADLGPRCTIGRGASVPEGARLPALTHVPAVARPAPAPAPPDAGPPAP